MTKICETELIGKNLNSMPTSWSKHAHVQGFYCGSVTFKAVANMFE